MRAFWLPRRQKASLEMETTIVNQKRMFRYVWCFFPLAALTAAAAAQESGAPPEMARRVYRLTHGDANDASQMLGSVLPQCRTGVDIRSNSIVVSGPAQDVESALKLIAELDVPVPPESEADSRIIQLHGQPPAEFPSLLETLLGRTRFAFDARSGILILRNPTPGQVEQVQRLLGQIEDADRGRVAFEEETRGLTATFYFVSGEYGSKVAAAGTDTHVRSERDSATWAALEKPTTADFNDEPFEAVIRRLAESGQIDITVNWIDLEGVGIDADLPVSLHLTTPMALRTVLQACLDAVGGGGIDLGFSVQDGLVKVATRGLLDRDTTIEVYDVRDLIDEMPAQALAGDSSAAAVRVSPSVDDLVEAIYSSVAPDSWRENNGDHGSASPVNGQLIVAQTEAAHQAIRELLAKLRLARSLPDGIGRTPLPPVLQPVAAALEETGIRNVALLAPLTVRVRHDKRFEYYGTALGVATTSMKVEGRAERRPGTDIVDLEMAAMLNRSPAWPRAGEGPKTIFELENSVTVKLGDLVVLAASPATTDNAQAVALVVRVTEGN
jgi:hypothetical protein